MPDAIGVQQRFEGDVGSGSCLRLVTRNTLVATLDDDVISAVTRLQGGPAPTVIALRSLGGAFGRIPKEATAFAHRDVEALIVVLLMLPETASDSTIQASVEPWRSVAAEGIDSYANFQGSATPADLASAYPPETLARLTAVKRRYDPANRFALNRNIAPHRRQEN